MRSANSTLSRYYCFVRILRHYFMCIVVPIVLLAGVIMGVYVPTVRQSLEGRVQERIEGAYEAVAQSLESARAIGLNLAYKQNVIPALLSSSNEMRNEITRLLHSYCAGDALYYDIAVCFPQVTYSLFTSGGSVDIEQLSPFFMLDSDIDTYVSVLEAISKPTLIAASYGARSPSPSSNYFQNDDIIYVMPVAFNGSSKRYLTMMFVLNRSRLSYLAAQSMQEQSGTLYMLNAADRPVFHYGADVYSETDFATITSLTEREGTLFFCAGQSGKPMRQIYALDTAEFTAMVYQSLRPMLICMLAALAVSLLICALLSMRAYMPLAQLSHMLHEDGSSALPPSYGTDAAQTALTLLSEPQQFINQLGQLTTVMQFELVRRMLSGNLSGAITPDQLLARANIPLRGPLYVALYLRLSQDMNAAQLYELALNLNKDLNWTHDITPIIPMPDDHALLLIASLPAGLSSERYKEHLLSTVRALLADYDLESRVGISRIKHSTAELAQAYAEAQTELSADIDGTLDSIPALYSSEAALEVCIVQLRTGNPRAALDSLHEWFESLRERADAAQKRISAIRMLDMLFEVLVECDYCSTSAAADRLQQLIIMHDSNAMEAEISRVLGACVAHDMRTLTIAAGDGSAKAPHMAEINAPAESPNAACAKGESLAMRLQEYINLYAFDPLFNMTTMAEAFDMTTFTFSRVFKKQFGRTFVDYVSQMRIERAKELLRLSDMKLKDIVEAIGYVDVSNFIRKFKLTEGITPGEYRKKYSL